MWLDFASFVSFKNCSNATPLGSNSSVITNFPEADLMAIKGLSVVTTSNPNSSASCWKSFSLGCKVQIREVLGNLHYSVSPVVSTLNIFDVVNIVVGCDKRKFEIFGIVCCFVSAWTMIVG